jgi:hypothetical protein
LFRISTVSFSFARFHVLMSGNFLRLHSNITDYETKLPNAAYPVPLIKEIPLVDTSESTFQKNLHPRACEIGWP